MSDPGRASEPVLRRPAWTAARVAWAIVGALGLTVSGVGAYLSMHASGDGGPETDASQAPEGAFVFRTHAVPRALPDIAFEDGGGRKRTLAEFRGKTVLLNVWATWCAPCREEMPSLDRLQQKLGGPGFEVVALSIDAGGAAAVKRFYGELGVRALATYVDPAARAFGSLGVVGVPTTLLIDREGRELGRLTGPAQWDSEQAVRLIQGYLERARS
ncbi:MAG: TlpA disulfide reductase family protein [Betaproteobacteria bacterium]